MKAWLAIALLLCLGGNVGATTRYGNVNAVGACQASLPVYDKNLRRRAIAITNDGTTGVYLSCSAQNHAYSGSYLINATLKNYKAEAVTVSCTLMEGAHSTAGGDWYYLPKSVVIPAYDTVDIRWNASLDNGGINFYRVNFTCSLPPGTEIGEISNVWDEEP